MHVGSTNLLSVSPNTSDPMLQNRRKFLQKKSALSEVYADDLTLTASDPFQLQERLKRLELYAPRFIFIST